jgi:hypothetical protein
VLLLCTGGSISTSICCCSCWSIATNRWCWQGQGVCSIGLPVLLLLFLLGALLLILLLLRLRALRGVCCGRVL